MRRSDITAWNLVYMVVYFFNVVNAGSMLANQAPEGVLLSIYIFQAVIFTLLLFSKSIISALLSIIIPSGTFVPWSIIMGTVDITQVFLMPLAFCLVIVITGFVRARLLKRMQGKPEKSPGATIPLIKTKPSGISRDQRLLAIADGCTTIVTIVIMSAFIIFSKNKFIPALAAWALCMLAIVPLLLVIMDCVFIILPDQPRMIYHPVLTHHFIEDANHTIPARFGKVSIFFCTRCTGMLIGLFISMYGFATFQITLPPLVALVVDCFLPMPIFIDWGTQRLGYRESTTKSRIVTGAIVGLGFALVPQASVEYPLGSSILLMVYFAIFILLFYIGMRRVPRNADDDFQPEFPPSSPLDQEPETPS